MTDRITPINAQVLPLLFVSCDTGAAGAGGGEGSGAGGGPLSDAPQFSQNWDPSGLSEPQDGHFISKPRGNVHEKLFEDYVSPFFHQFLNLTTACGARSRIRAMTFSKISGLQ
jgi:hypothetical protein